MYNYNAPIKMCTKTKKIKIWPNEFQIGSGNRKEKKSFNIYVTEDRRPLSEPELKAYLSYEV